MTDLSPANLPSPPLASQWPERRRPGGRALLLTAALCSATAQAADTQDPLINLINTYRESPNSCNGQQRQPVGPLAPSAALSDMRIASGAPLQTVLQEADYQAAQAQAIGVSGPSDPTAAMRAIRQRYCDVLLNPQFAEIGVSRQGTSWQVVLARPLLSSELGDWQRAGQAVLERVNAARAEARACGSRQFDSAPPLNWDAQLAAAALAHSRDMANGDFFSHAGSDGSQVNARADREGYAWRQVGENIAAGQGSAKQVVSGWLASPPHCANIMNPDFTEIGAAYATNPDSQATIYWTQVFGTPR